MQYMIEKFFFVSLFKVCTICLYSSSGNNYSFIVSGSLLSTDGIPNSSDRL